jgi:hypothetical protein
MNSNNTKCFCILDCDVLEQIQQEVINYLNNHTDLLIVKPEQPWNITDTQLVIKNCPSIIRWLMPKKIIPNEISFIVSHDLGIALDIHTDEPPLISKINVPIQNTTGNITRWHDNTGEVIAEYNMTKPVVFNSSIPHSVEIFNTNLPRVVMSIMCNNEKPLLKLLQTTEYTQ